MPGRRSSEFCDFITPRANYRVNITVVDSVGPESGTIPTIDTRDGPNTNVGLGQGSTASYGRNAQLDLAFIVADFTSLTYEIWLKATLDRAELSTVAPPTAPTLPSTDEWVLVREDSLTESSLLIVKDIPPGQYKILITELVGTPGAVTIREQHAA
jgi:hypothetical protein